MAGQTAYAKQMSSTEATNRNEGQELSCYILDLALELGENV